MKKYLFNQILYITLYVDNLKFDTQKQVSFILEVSEKQDFSEELRKKEEQIKRQNEVRFPNYAPRTEMFLVTTSMFSI